MSNLAVLAVVDRVVRGEAVARHGEAAGGNVGRLPLGEQRFIEAAEECDGDDLFGVIDGGHPAGKSSFANVIAVPFALLQYRHRTALIVNPN